MSERVEISPATIGQVHRSQKGKLVAVTGDVQGVAGDLHAIRSTLRLFFDPVEDFWIVQDTRTLPDGSEEEYLVTTAQQLDQRIVQRVREISQPGYDYAAELERLDAEADRRASESFREKMGDGGERLAHALCKDLGMTSGRAHIPRGVS